MHGAGCGTCDAAVWLCAPPPPPVLVCLYVRFHYRTKLLLQCLQALMQMMAADPAGGTRISQGDPSCAYVLSNGLSAIVPGITVNGSTLDVYCTWVQATGFSAPNWHQFGFGKLRVGSFDLTNVSRAKEALAVRRGQPSIAAH